MIGKEELGNRLGFHKATIEGENATLPRHVALRKMFLDFAQRLDEVTGDNTRAKIKAFDFLEEAAMWSHKAVAADAPLLQE